MSVPGSDGSFHPEMRTGISAGDRGSALGVEPEEVLSRMEITDHTSVLLYNNCLKEDERGEELNLLNTAY